MNADSADGKANILDEKDYERVMRFVLTQAGPNGLDEDELLRRTNLMAQHIIEWKISAQIYEFFRAGQVRLELSEDEADVRLINEPEEVDS